MLQHVSARRVRGALAFVSVFAASALPASAATLRVPADFPTIQGAIDAAVAGDEVLVAPGLYPEAIDFDGKAIVVRSENGAARTFLDGGGAPVYVVRFDSGEGSSSVLEGFTVTGGVGSQAGGVLVQGASPVLSQLRIAGNVGAEGGGLRIENGAPLVEGCRFEDNEAFSGAGLYSLFGAPVLRDVVFVGNRASNGGGLWVGGGALRIEGGEFRENFASSLGAGLYLNHVQVDLVELDVRANGERTLMPDGSSIFHTFGGGGLYSTQASGRIDRARFEENVGAAGGGVYVAGGGTLELLNCLVARNVAGIAGGGVYCNGSSPRLVQCTVARNFPGGLFTTFVSFPVVRNSILAQNGNEVYVGVDVYGNGNANLAYSLVQDPVLTGATLGVGMIEADPLFADDFSLLAGSLAIDAGDNGEVPFGIKRDLDDAPRFVDDPSAPDTGVGPAPIVDMGALERQMSAMLRGRR